jgi:hypothetical protein
MCRRLTNMSESSIVPFPVILKAYLSPISDDDRTWCVVHAKDVQLDQPTTTTRNNTTCNNIFFLALRLPLPRCWWPQHSFIDKFALTLKKFQGFFLGKFLGFYTSDNFKFFRVSVFVTFEDSDRFALGFKIFKV